MLFKSDVNPPKILRLRKRADFLRVRNTGQAVATRSCIIQYAKRSENMGDSVSCVGIGFTATKKIGKATVRNRAKRRLKAIILDKNLQLKSGYDIVLIARSATPNRSWDKLQKDIKHGLQQAHLI